MLRFLIYLYYTVECCVTCVPYLGYCMVIIDPALSVSRDPPFRRQLEQTETKLAETNGSMDHEYTSTRNSQFTVRLKVVSFDR
jgi:hypothetical protein